MKKLSLLLVLFAILASCTMLYEDPAPPEPTPPTSPEVSNPIPTNPDTPVTEPNEPSEPSEPDSPPTPVPPALAHPVPLPNPALFPYPNAFADDNETEQSANNLLLNPSFTDDSGWSNCETPVSTSISNGSLSIAPGVCFFQNVAATAGKTYTLTCKGKMDLPIYSVFTLSALDADFQSLVTESAIIDTSNRQWRTTLVAPENSRHVGVGFYTESTASYEYCYLTTETPAPLNTETLFPPVKKLEVILPIYIDPAASTEPWDQAITAAADVPVTVVINPVSGGINGCQDESFKTMLTKLETASVDTVGYIPSGYTNRDIALVKADIDSFTNCDTVDGIFFDEVRASNAEEAAYYQEICEYSKTAFENVGKFIINPGTNVVLPFKNDACNINLIYEFDEQNWQNYSFFGYEGAASDPALAVLIHTVMGVDAMKKAVDITYSRKADYIYVTDTTIPNPWITNTSYWTDFIAYLAEKNALVSP